jgi:hypothetical protein
MKARILADVSRGKLVPSVHIVGRESRQIKKVLRQRCFFVRQRTMLRNRIYRLKAYANRRLVARAKSSIIYKRKNVE